MILLMRWHFTTASATRSGTQFMRKNIVVVALKVDVGKQQTVNQ